MSLIKYFFLFSELGNYVRIAEVSDIMKCIYKQNYGLATIINAEGVITMWAYQWISRLWKGICIGFNYRIIICTLIW